MPTIKAIPTTYNGVRFRSRLEAKWAAVFDLIKWPWTYEPFELDNYIPDFVIPFEDGTDVLVEIKPYIRLDWEVWKPAADKIDASGWAQGELVPTENDCTGCWTRSREADIYPGCRDSCSLPGPEKPALILGAEIWEIDEYAGPVVGWFRDDSLWNCGEWDHLSIIRCGKCKAVFPYALYGERSCRRCGCDDKHYMGGEFPIQHYWNHVKNNMQWRRNA